MKRSKIGPTVFQALRTFLLSHYNLHVRKGKGKEYSLRSRRLEVVGIWQLRLKIYFLRKPRRVFRLPTSDLRLHTSNFRLQTSDLTKFELRISDVWPLRLNAAWLDFWPPISHFLLPTSHFPLLTFDFRLPTSNFRLPTSDFRLPISNFPLPTSNFPLLTFDFRLDSSVRLDCRSIRHAGINAQGQGSVERTAVPF